MTSKMLIDASHPEETRVVVTKGNRVEEFDFESALRKQLRGNIYLAKVTRVEPSLQAAFVDFGGNRHGFLAFSEIHPDYYQIPTADRQALLDDEARAQRDEEDEEEGRGRRGNRRNRKRPERAKAAATDSVSEAAPEGDAAAEDAGNGDAVAASDVEPAADQAAESAADAAEDAAEQAANDDADNGDESNGGDEDSHPENPEDIVEQIGGADAMEEVPVRHQRSRRQYKIQEVIKRRQILLVQVVKEERGNKGAALTTYLSLAGRYSVLMPNTARGGGISRKITNSVDRKRLKTIAQDLEVPDGMGVILRTAGAARTKTEVKRDFEYLMRLWESVRELTLQSTAPSLVYEEGSLIKRAIRDLYSKEVEEVLVSGDEGYREAKDFMKMLMPSHAKMVKLYKEPQPLFARSGVEAQLDAMFNNVVTLKSGGYIVINQTEALVSIDVNSGRSTREHNIEDTALKTNLEAAEEIGRQLRLRDLAGLIVIDFIDMEEKRNNRTVERKINDCLKNDRARIQLGRISHFGLLEMSRQRIRTGVLESSTSPCPHCAGTGLKRGTASIALNLVRAIEEALMKNAAYDLIVRTPTEIALYVLNHKRETLVALEGRFGAQISLRTDESILPPAYHAFERGEPASRPVTIKTAVETTSIAPVDEDEEVDVEIEADEDEADEAAAPAQRDNREPREAREPRGEDGNGGRRRRRRRRRRGGRNGDGENGSGPREAGDGIEGAEGDAQSDDQADGAGPNAEAAAGDERPAAAGEGAARDDEDRARKRRRRRGGRRNRREDGERVNAAAEEGSDDNAENEEAAGDVESVADLAPAVVAEPVVVEAAPVEEPAAPVKKPRSRARKIKIEMPAVELRDESAGSPVHAVAHTLPDVAVVKPEIAESDEGPVSAPAEIVVRQPEPAVIIEDEPEDPNRPKKTGWWAKAKKAIGG